MADIRSALVAWVSELLQSIPAAGLQRCLFDVLWQTTAIGLATVAVLLVFRGRASVRAWLALLGVLLCVAAPIGTLAVRAGNCGHRPVLVNVEAPAEVLVDSQLPPVVEAIEAVDLSPPPADFGGLPIDEPVASSVAGLSEAGSAIVDPIEVGPPAAGRSEAGIAPITREEPRSLPPATVAWSLIALWGVLSLVCLVRLGRSARLLRRLTRLARPCNDAEIQQAIARAAEKVGLRRAPSIAFCSAVDSPAIIAWGRGRLLLPETQPEGTDLFAVACHELAHLRRGDGWSRLMVEIVCALIPWQPLLWRLRASFRRDCEEACDDWVVALGTDPIELAATLANWLRPAPATLALGMSESVAVTRRRILRLLAQQKRPKARLGRLWLAAGLIIALSCGAGMAFWQTPEPPSAEPPNAEPNTPAAPPSEVLSPEPAVPPSEVPPTEAPPDVPAAAEPADSPAPLDAPVPESPIDAPANVPPAAERSEPDRPWDEARIRAELKGMKPINFAKAEATQQLQNVLARLQTQLSRLTNKRIEIIELQKAVELVEKFAPSDLEIDKKLMQEEKYVDKVRILEGYLAELRAFKAQTANPESPAVKRMQAKIKSIESETAELRGELVEKIRRSMQSDRASAARAALEAAQEAAKMLEVDVLSLESKARDSKEALTAYQPADDREFEKFHREMAALDALETSIALLREKMKVPEQSDAQLEDRRTHLQKLETQQLKLQQQLLKNAARLLNSVRSESGESTAANPAAAAREVQPYRIAPPDVLLIDSLNLTRSDPKIVRGDQLRIEVTATPEDEPISGMFKVDSRGRVTLGPSYGVVEVGGLDSDQAAEKIKKHLESIIIQPGVSVEVAESTPLQKIAGEHLVGPDGRVNLGVYGNVALAGATLDEAQSAVEEHLKKKGYDATISVSVMSYNSRVYYVIVERDVEVIKGHYSELQTSVLRFPLTGNETALDALSQGNVRLAGKAKVTLARPKPDGGETRLDVDWKSIVAGDSTKTNYRLQSGDRLYVKEQGEAKQVEKPQGIENFVPTDVK